MAKIKIDDELFSRVKGFAEEKGYSSAEEFIAHLLEVAVNPDFAGEEDADVLTRLRGLGYIS